MTTRIQVSLALLVAFSCAMSGCSDPDPTSADTDASDQQDVSSDVDVAAEDTYDVDDLADAEDAVDTFELWDVADLTDSSDDPDLQNDLDDTELHDQNGPTDADDPDADDPDADDPDAVDPDADDPDAVDPDADDPDADTGSSAPLVVNSLLDLDDPPEGTLTLRAALEIAASGETIWFDQSLDGKTIELSIVGAEHTVLKGEVMGMREEPSGPVSYLVGYFERDYGRSALYAAKNVVIDASALSLGITLAWTGGAENPARVLAVYGNLTMNNITITGGYSITESLPSDDPEAQPWTLGRGGGVAVWGEARLENCTLYDNHCVGDFDSSRDRGAYGGGLYADIVDLDRCVVSGNTVVGAGAAGGGVYSVGGAESSLVTSSISQSAITGNRISGLFTYGGGIYSDGGGIGNLKTLEVTSSTIAWNVVEPPPGVPPFLLAIGYWRGGGMYMSNGHLKLQSSTVVENEVYGVPRTDSLSRPNLAGGIAATIGNAHAVETMVISHSIVVGNTVVELGMSGPTGSYNQDIFTGSLLHFISLGYNRFGVLDFSQMLVPVGIWGWNSLCRRHYPKIDDEDGVLTAEVLRLDGGITYSDTIFSAGVDTSNPVVLHYEPGGDALDRIPWEPYRTEVSYASYRLLWGGEDNFLSIVLDRIQSEYGISDFASEFTDDFESYLQTVDSDDDTEGVQPFEDPYGMPILSLSDTFWFGPANTWPQQLWNYPYIEFWHRLDEELAAAEIPELGPALLNDDEWNSLFESGVLAENDRLFIGFATDRINCLLEAVDQLGALRPANALGDIGAIEIP